MAYATQAVNDEHLFCHREMEPVEPRLTDVSYVEVRWARSYLPQTFGETTMKEVACLRRFHGVSDRRRFVLKPPPEPEQLSLLR